MCVATQSSTQPQADRLSSGVSGLFSAFRDGAIASRNAVNNLDPDLKDYYDRYLSRPNSFDLSRRLLSPQQYEQRSQVLAEQKRRDELRDAYAQAERAANDQLTQIAEQQKQAVAANAAEAERQAQLQRDLEQSRLLQQQRIAQERLATQAATASMAVLRRDNSSAAPVAQMAGRGRSVAQPRASRSAQSLRIGGTAAGPGVGMNIGG